MRSSSAAFDKFPFVRLSTASMKHLSNSATASSNSIPRSTISDTRVSNLLFISILLRHLRYLMLSRLPDRLVAIEKTFSQFARSQISDHSCAFQQRRAKDRSLDGFGPHRKRSK